MATHDYVIDNSTGANVRADINSVLQAILTNNSSSSAPSTTAAYMWWADTTNGVLKIRNSSDNAWVELLQLDGTLTLEDGSVSTPALSFRDDLNTGVYSSAADTFNVATAGVERMELGATTIFNEDGADVDFRIEGDTDANLFHVDAGNDRIGISTSTPDSLFHVFAGSAGSISAAGSAVITLEKNGDTALQFLSPSSNNQEIRFGDESDNGSGYIQYSHASNFLSFGLNGGSEKMRINSSGKIGIGTTSPDQILHVHRGSAGSVDSTANSVLTLENSGDVILQFLAPSSNVNQIRFGDPSDDGAGYIDYNHGNNALSFGTAGGGEDMRLDSSGRLGISTTSPTKKLEIQSTTTNDGVLLKSSSSNYLAFIGSTNRGTEGQSLVRFEGQWNDTAVSRVSMLAGADTTNKDDGVIAFATASGGSMAEAMRINSDATVAIGPNNAGHALLTLSQSASAHLNALAIQQGNTGSGSGDGLFIGIDSNADAFMFHKENRAIEFGTANTERMRLADDGEIILGNTSSPGTAHAGISLRSTPSGLPTYIVTSSRQHGTSAYTHQEFFNTNGSVGSITTSGSGTSYATSSDYRLKENETAITDGITRLKQLKPYKFNWKTDASTIVDGFFAHEVSSIVPEAVTGDKDYVATQANVNSGHAENVGDPIYQKIDHSRLVPLLVAAVKELITKVETLEAA